ncbi:hypothetical protein TNCV_311841 [Trichonephila clavipes]|nr:hypothetical protein TNCV_311841 [Trichonephila clavipes]
MTRGPQATGAPTRVSTVPLTGYSCLKKSPEEILIQGPFRTSYASGEHAPSIRICETWFQQFKSGNFNMKERERERALVDHKSAKRALQELLDDDPTQTQQQLAKTLNL